MSPGSPTKIAKKNLLKNIAARGGGVAYYDKENFNNLLWNLSSEFKIVWLKWSLENS